MFEKRPIFTDSPVPIHSSHVPLTMTSPETREREFRPLNGICDNWKKTILTLDRLGLGSEEGIDVVNLYDWLLSQ